MPSARRRQRRAAGDANRRRQVAVLPAARARARAGAAAVLHWWSPPLIALMEDQVQKLKARGLRAGASTRGARARESRAVCRTPIWRVHARLPVSLLPSAWRCRASPAARQAYALAHRRRRGTASRTGATTSAPSTACWASGCPCCAARCRVERGRVGTRVPVVGLTASATSLVQADIVSQRADRCGAVHPRLSPNLALGWSTVRPRAAARSPPRPSPMTHRAYAITARAHAKRSRELAREYADRRSGGRRLPQTHFCRRARACRAPSARARSSRN